MSSKNLPALPDGVKNLPVLTQDLGYIQSVLQENLGAANLSAGDLDKIKVPSGNTPLWAVQTIDGPKGFDALEGIVVMVQMARSYWQGEDVSNSPPDCSSNDLIHGFGRRGDNDEHDGPHECVGCPMNEFGSAIRKGQPAAGKACNERVHLFLLMGSGYLPVVVQVPSTSLAAWRKYIARLSSFGKPFNAVVTKITLAPKRNKSGTEYMECVFSSAGELPAESVQSIRAYSEAFKPAFSRATRAAQDDIDDDTPPPYEDDAQVQE